MIFTSKDIPVHPAKFLCNWTPSSKNIRAFPVRTFHVTVKKTKKQKNLHVTWKKNLFFWSRGMKQDKRKSWSLIEMPLKYRRFSLTLFSAKILSIRTSHATHKKTDSIDIRGGRRKVIALQFYFFVEKKSSVWDGKESWGWGKFCLTSSFCSFWVSFIFDV